MTGNFAFFTARQKVQKINYETVLMSGLVTSSPTRKSFVFDRRSRFQTRTCFLQPQTWSQNQALEFISLIKTPHPPYDPEI